ncbi:hypothetical protein [Ancylobacter moscoviensis]
MIDLPVFDAGRTVTFLSLDDASAGVPKFRPSAAAGAPTISDGRTIRSPAEHRAAIETADDAEEHEGAGTSNLRKEFDEGRLPPDLRETAEVLETLFARALAPPARPTIAECLAHGRLNGAERHARANQVLRLVAYRCGHLYPDLVRAVVLDESMSSIGLDLGGNSKDASKLGRQRVIDALVFAHGALADMDRWQRRHERKITSNAPITPILARAIGQKSMAPAWVHEAANDDLRKLKVAA